MARRRVSIFKQGVRISACSSAQIGPRRGFKVSSAPRHCACERSFSCRKKSRVGPNYSDRLWCCPSDVLKFSAIFLKSSAARRDLRSVSVWGLLQARDVMFLPDFAVLRKCFVRESTSKLVTAPGTAAMNASYYAGKSPARVQNIGRHCSAVQSRFLKFI